MKQQNSRLSKIKKLINNFTTTKILVLGDAILDHYIWGEVNRISPEAPVPVVKIKGESFALGGAANVANNIVSLGGQAFLAGLVGADEYGEKFISILREKGISTEGISIDTTRPTTLKTRVVSHRQQMLRIDRESIGELVEIHTKKLLHFIKQYRDKIDVIILEDYGKGVINKKLIEEVLTIVRNKKKSLPVLVDPKKEHFSLYRGVDLITPNHLEASTATGIEIKDLDTLVQAGKKLLTTLNCKNVLITRGEEGMSLFEKNGPITHIPTVAREVFDVSGAGDTVISAFALAIAAGGEYKIAADIANHAAGVVVGKVGVATVTPVELLDSLLKEH